jgi:hypothetical protein
MLVSMCTYAPWGLLVDLLSICKVLALYLVKDFKFSTCDTCSPKNICPRVIRLTEQWCVGAPVSYWQISSLLVILLQVILWAWNFMVLSCLLSDFQRIKKWTANNVIQNNLAEDKIKFCWILNSNLRIKKNMKISAARMKMISQYCLNCNFSYIIFYLALSF